MEAFVMTAVPLSQLRSIFREEQEQAIKKLIPSILTNNQVNNDLANSDKYISKKEAAEIAGVGTSTIDNWIRAKQFTKYKFAGAVRIKLSELIRFLETKVV